MTLEMPLQIKPGNIPLTPEIEAYIRERAERLQALAGGTTSCRVTIDAPVAHHQKGGPFEVSVNMLVPGAQLVVNRQADPSLHAAIRHEFDAAGRQLEDHVRRIRGQVKVEETPPRGKIARLFRTEGYGFIATPDGRELYFHANSVLPPGFDELEVDQEVRYAEEQGDKGPQASTVAATANHTR